MPSWNIHCVLRSRLKLVSMERKMMMLMWSRKKLMLRRRILRRKTHEARTQTYTLCEPAQSKCTSTCHKSRTIRKFTGNTPQTRVRSTQIRHLPLHLAKEPLSVDKLFGESKDRLQLPDKRVTSGLLDLSLARAHGHPGTTRSTGTRAHGHTGTTPIHGHTGKGHQSTALRTLPLCSCSLAPNEHASLSRTARIPGGYYAHVLKLLYNFIPKLLFSEYLLPKVSI